MRVVLVIGGLAMVAAGSLAIVFRRRLLRWSTRAQRDAFGPAAEGFQRSQTEITMVLAGSIGIVFGVLATVNGLVRLGA